MNNAFLKKLLMNGLSLTVLASLECLVIEDDISEEAPDWVGGVAGDEGILKAEWRIYWESRIRQGLIRIPLEMRPTILAFRSKELQPLFQRLKTNSGGFLREQILIELSSFGAYWPIQWSETQYKRLFLRTEIQQSSIDTAAVALGLPPETVQFVQTQIPEILEAISPPRLRKLWQPQEEWPLTRAGRGMATPFLENTFPHGGEVMAGEAAEGFAASLAMLGAGLMMCRGGERDLPSGAWACGLGLVVDQESGQVPWLPSFPIEALAWSLTKMLVLAGLVCPRNDNREFRTWMADGLVVLMNAVRAGVELGQSGPVMEKIEDRWTLLFQAEKRLRI